MPAESPIIWFINGASRDFEKVSGYYCYRGNIYQDYSGSYTDFKFGCKWRIVQQIFFIFVLLLLRYYYYLFFACFSINIDDVFFISITRRYISHLYYTTIRPRLSPLAGVQRVIGHLLHCNERRWRSGVPRVVHYAA